MYGLCVGSYRYDFVESTRAILRLIGDFNDAGFARFDRLFGKFRLSASAGSVSRHDDERLRSRVGKRKLVRHGAAGFLDVAEVVGGFCKSDYCSRLFLGVHRQGDGKDCHYDYDKILHAIYEFYNVRQS